jgi:hypothetical protein
MSDTGSIYGGGGRETSGAKGGGRKDMDRWWEERTLPQKILLGIAFGILGIGLLALCGWLVMVLWNWLMPDLFGLKRLDYWRAWGVLVLCTVLFKGLPRASDSTDRKRRKRLRQYMQDEQQPAQD